MSGCKCLDFNRSKQIASIKDFLVTENDALVEGDKGINAAYKRQEKRKKDIKRETSKYSILRLIGVRFLNHTLFAYYIYPPTFSSSKTLSCCHFTRRIKILEPSSKQGQFIALRRPVVFILCPGLSLYSVAQIKMDKTCMYLDLEV